MEMIESEKLRDLVYKTLKDIQWRPNVLENFMNNITDEEVIEIIKLYLDDNWWFELVRKMDEIKQRN